MLVIKKIEKTNYTIVDNSNKLLIFLKNSGHLQDR